MKAKLISHSKSSGYLIKSTSPLELIAFCARVSNPENQFNTETSEKLVKYLVKHKHWSPLEMVSACLEIETTRDIARQILRHRSFSFQEFSQRYADPTKEMEFVIREARIQDHSNRQNSIDVCKRNIEKLGTLYRITFWKWNTKRTRRNCKGMCLRYIVGVPSR